MFPTGLGLAFPGDGLPGCQPRYPHATPGGLWLVAGGRQDRHGWIESGFKQVTVASGHVVLEQCGSGFGGVGTNGPAIQNQQSISLGDGLLIIRRSGLHYYTEGFGLGPLLYTKRVVWVPPRGCAVTDEWAALGAALGETVHSFGNKAGVSPNATPGLMLE